MERLRVLSRVSLAWFFYVCSYWTKVAGLIVVWPLYSAKLTLILLVFLSVSFLENQKNKDRGDYNNKPVHLSHSSCHQKQEGTPEGLLSIISNLHLNCLVRFHVLNLEYLTEGFLFVVLEVQKEFVIVLIFLNYLRNICNHNWFVDSELSLRLDF